MMYNELKPIGEGRKYVAPRVDAVEINPEQVLCTSGEDAKGIPEFFYEEW